MTWLGRVLAGGRALGLSETLAKPGCTKLKFSCLALHPATQNPAHPRSWHISIMNPPCSVLLHQRDPKIWAFSHSLPQSFSEKATDVVTFPVYVMCLTR